MAYCVNPYCQDPDNSITSGSTQPPTDFSTERLCHSCQTPLLIKARYTVMGKPLCDRNPTLTPSSRVFEVRDRLEPQTPKVLKVLCSGEPKLVKLFVQEQQILMNPEYSHGGIPKGYDAFNVETLYGQTLPCLVMEKIMGLNLEQRRSIRGAIDADTALSWLKQLTDILHHIHQQDFFHRDIKPSNIMQRSSNGRLVLIDFGAARRVTETIVSGNPSTVVTSYKYTAPEQLNGQAEKRSDFYALGKTILYLMTDSPQSRDIEDSPPVNQRDFAIRSKVKLSPAFEKLLIDLIDQSPNRRPRDTSELLRRINDIDNEEIRRKRKNMLLIFAGGIACGATIMTPLIKQINWEQVQQSLFPVPACDKQVGDLISCGEEMLLDGLNEGVSSPEDKKTGIQAFSSGDYKKSQDFLQKAFDREKDPETLIYLNNAKINVNSQLAKRKVTIAAVVPLGKKEAQTRAIAMLRGVGQAQSHALEHYGLGLQVVLVDDKNNPVPAKEISRTLVKRKDILGGIGHASSDALIAALPQYEMHKFVFIAPASTSEELSSAALRKDHIFFRSLPSNRVNANFMVALLTSDLKRPKIAIYYNPASPYSRSLASELRATYQIHGGEVLLENQGLFRIEQENFDAKQSLKYARDRGASVHVLIPDGAVQSTSASNSLALVKENAGRDWIIAGDSLAGVPEYLKGGDDGVAQYALGKMIFSASWDPSVDLTSPLLSYWNSTKQSKSLVDWRTHTSYNAVWMMATALNSTTIHTREQLRIQLSQPNFQAIRVGSGDESKRKLSFQEESGEIADPMIHLSIVAKCGDRYTTVPYKNPVCPDGKPAFPKSNSDVAE
jgi:eukaryotic-like serine/threonine-protein kinase